MPDAAPIPYDRLGEYRIVREVGRGGMGVVYEAMQESLQRRAALKVLPLTPNLTDDHVRRFQREASAAASLTHPNCVTVYGVGQDQGVHFIAMEFIDGESLDRRIKRMPDGLPFDEVCEIGLQVASGLAAAHEAGVLHRDVKPSNLMVLSAPDASRGAISATAATVQIDPAKKTDSTTGTRQGVRVKVTDFGLAKPIDDVTMTASGSILGTPMYMSPEQVRGEELDGRSDVYSLGMVLYEAVTAFPPFLTANSHNVLRKVTDEEPPRPRRWRRSIPRDLETVILKAIEKDRGRRYATAGDLEADLRRVLAGEAILARPVGPIGRLVRRAARNPLLAAVVTGVLIVGLGVGGAGLWKGGRASQEARAERRYADATALRTQGRSADAIAALQEAVRLAPGHVKAWRDLGSILLKERREGEARDALRKAVELRRTDAAAWAELARAEARCGDPAAGLRAADEAIRLAPESPGPLEARAEVWEVRGEVEKALVDRQRATGLATAEWGRLLVEVDGLLAAGKAAESVRRLAAFPADQRAGAAWQYRRGLAYADLSPGADAALLSALDRDGMTVRTEGMEPGPALAARAEEDLAAAAATGVAEPRLHVARASLARARGDREAALALWGKVLEAAPEDLEALRASASIAEELFRWIEVRRLLDRVLATAPDDAVAHLGRGRAFVLERMVACGLIVRKVPARDFRMFDASFVVGDDADAQQALGDLGGAIQANHETHRARIYRAALLSAMGRPVEAVAELDAALTARPDDVDTLAAKGIVLNLAGRHDEAEAIAAKLVAAKPASIEGWSIRTAIAVTRGDQAALSEASSKLIDAAMKDPSSWKDVFDFDDADPAAHGRFGITLADIGDGHRRFAREDLHLFVEALGSADERTVGLAENVLWKSGPRAVAALEAARPAGPAIDRSRRLLEAIRKAVEEEEDAAVRAFVDDTLRAQMTGNFAGAPAAPSAGDGGRVADAMVRYVRRRPTEDCKVLLYTVFTIDPERAGERAVKLLTEAPRELVLEVVRIYGFVAANQAASPPAEILAFTESPDAEIRALAIQQFAGVVGLQLEEAARRGFRESADHWQEYATALYIMDSTEGMEDLVESCEETEDPARRVQTLAFLARARDPRVLPLAREAMSGDDDPALSYAIHAIGWVGDREDVERLVELLESKDSEVVSSAAVALGRLGYSEAVDPLKRALVAWPAGAAKPAGVTAGPPDLAVSLALAALGREEAADGLRVYTEGASALLYLLASQRLAEPALPELSAAWLRQYRASSGPQRVLSLVPLSVCAGPAEVPGLLEEVPNVSSAQERQMLVTALAEAGDPAAAPALEAFARDPAGIDLELTLAWALGRCGKPPVPSERVRRLARNRSGLLHADEVLARAGDEGALAYLRSIIRGEVRFRGLFMESLAGIQAGPSIRLQAAQALALCGDRGGKLALAGMLDSRDVMERRRAWATLVRATGLEVPYRPLATRDALEKGKAAWVEALR